MRLVGSRRPAVKTGDTIKPVRRPVPQASFYRPSITREDRQAVAAVMRSGWLTSGPRAEAFEQAVARQLTVKYAVAVSSGTAALQLALEASGIGAGHEVITSPLTFTATAEAIIRAGARPVFADVTPGGLNIDPDAIAAKINSRTAAIIPVGIGGIPCATSSIRGLARKSGLMVIEDAAHTLGASYRGRAIGRWAHATAFSFYATKNLTTGEGGMVVTDSRRLADRVRLLANHGITRPTWARRQSGEYHYDVAALGLKANMSDLLAALGLSQLRRFDRLMSRRRRVMDWYRAALRDCDLIAWPTVPAHAVSSCHLCQVFLKTEELSAGRDTILQALQAAGVPCGVHFIPLYRFSYYRKVLGLRVRDFPATERAWRSVLTLPQYSDLPRRDVIRISQILISTLRQYRR